MAEALGSSDPASHAPRLEAAAWCQFSRPRTWMSTMPPTRQMPRVYPRPPPWEQSWGLMGTPPFPTMMRPKKSAPRL
eukprot:12367649-Alexandrium_andersonii.AAC.1